MRNLVGYNDLPKEISHQIDKAVNIWKNYLNEKGLLQQSLFIID